MKNNDIRVKKRILPPVLFVIIYVFMLISCTIPMFIIKDYLNYQMVTSSNVIFKTFMIWAVISLLLTLLITFNMHYRLTIPIRELSKATKLVANGDFSVYVPTRHTSDKLDDLDVSS